jgi:hypothetical protein
MPAATHTGNSTPSPKPPGAAGASKTLSPAEHTQRKQAINARWAAEQATDDELREMFQQIEMEKGLELLARMRKNCEVAAKALEARRTSGEDAKCKTCDKSLAEANIRDWRMRRPRRDPATNTIYIEHFCSDVCIALDNKLVHGIAVVSDRGVESRNSLIEHQKQMEKLARENTARQEKERRDMQKGARRAERERNQGKE